QFRDKDGKYSRIPNAVSKAVNTETGEEFIFKMDAEGNIPHLQLPSGTYKLSIVSVPEEFSEGKRLDLSYTETVTIEETSRAKGWKVTVKELPADEEPEVEKWQFGARLSFRNLSGKNYESLEKTDKPWKSVTGAVIKITNSETNKVYEFVTNESGSHQLVETGKYTIELVSVPEELKDKFEWPEAKEIEIKGSSFFGFNVVEKIPTIDVSLNTQYMDLDRNFSRIPNAVSKAVNTETGEEFIFKMDAEGNIPHLQLPSGTYKLSIVSVPEEFAEGKRLDLSYTETLTIEENSRAKGWKVTVKELPEVEKGYVTHGIYIDGKRQDVQNGKTPEESLPEELRNLNVKLTKVDDSSIVYEGALGPWRGSEGYPVSKNFDLKGIPTGEYKIEISGFDAENSKYKIVRGKENPLIDGEIIIVTTKTANHFVHFITSDIVPQEPGKDKPIVPENYVLVEFLEGENGTIAETETTKYWVNPEAGKTVADVAKPTVTPEENWKHTGWDKEDTTAITEALTVTAQYKAKVVTEDPNDEDYVKVSFETTRGKVEGTAEYWVLKDEQVEFEVPTVNMDDVENYTFKSWDPAIKASYSEDTVHNATFTYTGEDIVSQPGEERPDVPENFVLVEFKEGEHGTLEGTTKYWVNPEAGKTVADVAKPTVTPEENWKHTGWNKEDTTAITEALTVTAQYKAKVVTEDPNDEDYVKVSFETTRGKVEGTAEYWVLKDEQVEFEVPTVNMDDVENYTFKSWDPAIKASYSEDTVHNATFTYTGEDIVSQPGEDRPDVPENFVLVEFKEGEHGTLDGATKYWVNPEAGKTLADVAKPTVTPEENWKHTGWNKEDTTVITEDLEVTAQYEENDNVKYEPETDPIVKEPGEPTTEEEVIDKVRIPDYPEDKEAPKITVENPEDLPDGNTPGEYEVPVIVEYPDGSKDKTTVTVIVKDKPAPEKSKTPIVDKITEGDDKITGGGEPGSDIIVELPDGTKIPGKVDENGKWEVEIPADKKLNKDDKIKVVQKEKGKLISNTIEVIVNGKEAKKPSTVNPRTGDAGVMMTSVITVLSVVAYVFTRKLKKED
ncbi:Rib/alpha-like domain-containing protein, partial [Helcococcus sueciensis]